VRPRQTALRWALAAALLLSTAGATLIFARTTDRRHAAPATVPAVTLVDQRGAPVTSAALLTGGWSFVFLGFTSCPNVCPATLGQLAAVKRSAARLFPALPQPRFVFVSVDPQRDTPARLAAYLPTFDRDFLGVTGDPAQIAILSDALAAFHRRRAEKGPDDYGVVHSGEIYLFDPAGRIHARFTPPLDPDQIARDLYAEAKR
jgi:protein SCO1